MTLSAGSKLGPYEIVAPLGAGGMGEVYRAHDARLDIATVCQPKSR
jgi:serine/threonine protein kinase